MPVSAHPKRWTPTFVAFLIWTLPAVNACAQTQDSDQTQRLDQTQRSKATQPCVLLKNDNVLFGQASQLGEFIIIRTGPNDELKLPRSQVACWAKSPADLYRYRLDHRSTSDLNTHLADARWCLGYELFDQAAHEIEMAKAISPNHREVLLLEGQMRRRNELTNAKPAPLSPVATATFLNESFPTNDGEANRVDPITLKWFSSHVHTTLLNRCASCHNQRSDLNWQLTAPSRGTRATARITRENLSASLQFLDRKNPDQSPLLIMATSPHGGVDAPLGPRNAKAIDALRRWLLQTASFESAHRLGRVDRPEQPNASDSAQPIASIAQVTYTSEVDENSSAAGSSQTDSAVPARSAPKSAPRSALKPSDPKRLPTVANPFDPSLFNRRFHPDSK